MKKLILSVVALFAASFGVANAAIATSITDAITAAGTDAATLGVAVLVVLVGIRAFKWIRKAM